MIKTKIGIVGIGPRGASLLERIITYAIHYDISETLKILLFDGNGEFGVGCHRSNVPKNLTINTIADQITMYFGNEMSDYGLVYEGENLHEWAIRQNYKVEKTDYLPRRILGKYLIDFYEKQIARMKKNKISFIEVHGMVIDVINIKNKILLKTNNKKYIVNKAVLSLGHNGDDYLNCKYNINCDMDLSGKIVAIQGMGLTSFDVISDLTEGSGGKFERTESDILKYIRSGREPLMYLYSRTGVFLSGRVFNRDTKFIYEPVFFTFNAIKELKIKKKRINFSEDIIPLLNKELEYAFRLRAGKENFNFKNFWHPENELCVLSQEYLENSFYQYLKKDIVECKKGKFESPIKFCQDIVRDLRDVIRYAVEYNSLDDSSYEEFITYWQPIFNKVCVGPPCIRLEQLRALIDCGVCNFKHAKNPKVRPLRKGFSLESVYKNGKKEITIVDCVIKAKINSIDYISSNNVLIKNLRKRYKLFKNNNFYHGGLEITKQNNLIDRYEKICKNLYALGITTEGSKYFTFVLGRPNMVSTFLKDNNKVAFSLIKDL